MPTPSSPFPARRESDPYAPTHPIPAKPIVKSYPTPDLRDRVFVVRKDSRLAGYQLPAHGDAYQGPEQQKMEGFEFATAVPTDQTGWVDWYYLNERANEDAYNALVAYPYADKNYPQVTRTYTRLRSDVFGDASALPDEKQADAVDPQYPDLKLVDHKVIRFDDPTLDALFVNVQRVYERLPSPIIRSYEQNEVKQVVTIDTQEVVQEEVPTSSATTEVLKVERTTTAKSKVTTGTVPDVFPADAHEISIPDVLPEEMRAVIPTVTEAEDIEGDAVLPTLGTGELNKSEVQKNEFVKRTSVTKRADVLPKQLVDKDLEHLSQGRFGEGFASEGTVTKRAQVGDQNLDTGRFVTDSTVKQLGDGTTMKVTSQVADWPTLRQSTVDERDAIRVDVTKDVIDPLNASFLPMPNGYVDVYPYDKWRSIRVTSRVDLASLPSPQTFATGIDLNLPPQLIGLVFNWEESGGSSQSVTDDPNSGTGVATVSVSAGAMGSIAVKAKAGYRGKTLGTVTRYWFINPPTVAQLEAIGAIITPLITAQGSVSLISKHVTFGQTRGDNESADSNQGQKRVETVDISGYLTGSYSITNGHYVSAPSVAQATTQSGFQAALYLPGPVFDAVINIPVSNPGSFADIIGTEIVVDVQTTRRSFGLWSVEIFKVKVPVF